MDRNCSVFVDGRWKMFLKATGQSLVTAKMYRKATSGQFFKGFGKPLGNVEITLGKCSFCLV
jgi:hypothetical protein